MVALFRIVTHANINGSVALNNAYHVFTELATPTAANVAADFASNVWPGIRGNLNSNYLLDTVSAQRMLPDTADQASAIVNQTGGISLGAGTSVLRVNSICVLAGVITWRTPHPGRSGRGRTYVGGLVITSNDGVHWHSEQITSLTNIADTIRNHYQLGGNINALRLAVFSRKAGGRIPPYTDAGIQEVDSYTVQRYYCTMGSRRLGRGF